MSFEEFDKKIKEAADHHHPTYDQKAWEKMEKLLDTHLPQKKDGRRRYIFLLLLFLLTAGGLYFMIAKPWSSNKPSITDEYNRQNVSNTTNADPDNSENVINSKKDITINKVSKPTVEIKKGAKDQSFFGEVTKTEINRTKQTFRKNEFYLSSKNKPTNDPLQDDKSVQTKAETEILNDAAVNNNTIENSSSEKITLNKPAEEQKPNAALKSDSTKQNIDVASVPVPGKIKLNNKKRNSFSLSLSAAPDVSFTKLDNPGKVKVLVGAGIGYTFKNKFTLRTGFYAGRKIYSTNSDEYHTSNTVWLPGYSLDRIDADCKVYEIPLLVSYNFSHSSNQNWLVTMGLSSYIMKKEIYDYQYKGLSGQSYSYQRTLNNQNKHYFSVLTLSGGYQRNINNTFSIMAEPYMKVPLSGIGYGKVKLNNAGVLLSINMKLSGFVKSK